MASCTLLPSKARAKSISVVVPPNSAARLTTPGGSVRPAAPSGAGMGQEQWTCGSMPPGMTTQPAASISRAPSGSGRLPWPATAVMRPSRITTS